MGESKLSKIIVTGIITAIIVGGGVYLWQNKNAQPVLKQQMEKAEEARSLTDCSRLDSSWTMFSDSKTSLLFCYKNSWGPVKLDETVMSPEKRVGTFYGINFSKFRSPQIFYFTLNYKILEDDEPEFINWKSLDFSKTETELARLFDKNYNAIAQKLTINGKQLFKIQGKFPYDDEMSIYYLIPNVVISGKTYNLQIITPPGQESDVEKLLGSMTY